MCWSMYQSEQLPFNLAHTYRPRERARVSVTSVQTFNALYNTRIVAYRIWNNSITCQNIKLITHRNVFNISEY